MLYVSGLSLACEPYWSWQDLKFCCQSGQLLQLKGANGVGKSTCLKLLAGLLPREGHVTWSGVVPSVDYLLYIGSLQEGHSLTVESWLHQQSLRLRGCVCRADELGRWSSSQSLRQDMRLSGLSLGQRQRLQLLQLVMTNRPLWLLDEPWAHLDELSKLHWKEVLKNHLSAGGVALLVSHEDFECTGILNLELKPELRAFSYE